MVQRKRACNQVFGLLGQYFRDRLDAWIGKWNGTCSHVIVLLVINPQCLVDGRENFAGTNLAIGDRLAVLVRFPVDRSALDTTSRERNTPGLSKGGLAKIKDNYEKYISFQIPQLIKAPVRQQE